MAIKMRKKQFRRGCVIFCCYFVVCDVFAPPRASFGVSFFSRWRRKKFELSIQLVLHVNVFRYFFFANGKCVSRDGFSPYDLDKKMIGMRGDGVRKFGTRHLCRLFSEKIHLCYSVEFIKGLICNDGDFPNDDCIMFSVFYI